MEQWKRQLEEESNDALPNPTRAGEAASHPRWVRLNPLHGTSAQTTEAEVFKGWTHVDTLSELLDPPGEAQGKCYHRDKHIENLVATPAGTDLTTTRAYKTGRIILQDKASCFPATLLDPRHGGEDVIDACAAPGNKTSHLAALLSSAIAATSWSSTVDTINSKRPTIFAIERDPVRSKTLQTMLNKAGCLDPARSGLDVRILANQDFLALNPQDPRFADVRSILLDPSCSGSGIIGRDDGDDVGGGSGREYKLVLPRTPQEIAHAKANTLAGSNAKGQKRKRKPAVQPPASFPPLPLQPSPSPTTETHPQTQPQSRQHSPPPSSKQPERLKALNTFQHKLLTHAFRFPSATCVIYSTCSIHGEENESVVVRALTSIASCSPATNTHRTNSTNGAKSERKSTRGWRLLPRSEQPPTLREWRRRGDVAAASAAITKIRSSSGTEVEIEIGVGAQDVADACIRCAKGEGEGTMGFFVAGFVRDACFASASASGFDVADDEGWHEEGDRDVGDGDGDDEGSWDGFGD